MKNDSRLSKSKGFTLLELLVVILIIAALAALSFTAIKIMITKSRKVSSMNHLRQISIAGAGFSAENRGILPATTWGDIQQGGVIEKAYWWNYLGPFLYAEYDGKIDGLFRDNADPNVKGFKDTEMRTPSWKEISYTPWDNGTVDPTEQLSGISIPKTNDTSRQPYVTTALNDVGSNLRGCSSEAMFNENVLPTAKWRNDEIIVLYCDGSVRIIRNPTFEKVAPDMANQKP